MKQIDNIHKETERGSFWVSMSKVLTMNDLLQNSLSRVMQTKWCSFAPFPFLSWCSGFHLCANTLLKKIESHVLLLIQCHSGVSHSVALDVNAVLFSDVAILSHPGRSGRSGTPVGSGRISAPPHPDGTGSALNRHTPRSLSLCSHIHTLCKQTREKCLFWCQ